MPYTFTPLRYPGGKTQFYNRVVNIFHINNIDMPVYIEPFAGGAGLALKLLLTNKVKKIIINDLDEGVFSFWDTVINESDWLIHKIETIDITFNEWEKQKSIYNNASSFSKKEVGFAFLFLNRCNRSGILYAGPIGGKKQNGKFKLDCRFNKTRLIELIKRLALLKNCIQIFNLDALDFINKFKAIDNSFWFIDPPYFVKGSQLYRNSFQYRDHEQLALKIDACLKKQRWILTYDNHDSIVNFYKNYNHRLVSLTYSVGTKKKEYELLFFNNLVVPVE